MRQHIFDTLKKWLWVDDEEGIDIIYATAIASLFEGDPIWLFIIAPPGGCKTEILRSFSGQHIYSLSQLTAQTLISGFRPKDRKSQPDVDLLPKLDGKLVIIKDFTSILSKGDDARSGIFADLREAYDGYLEKAYGSGVAKKSYHATFGLIAGVTPVVDTYRALHTALGERFLKLRYKSDYLSAIKKAQLGSGKEKEMRGELAELNRLVLDFYKLRTKDISPISQATEVQNLAYITGLLRSDVARDRQHQVTYQPLPEEGTRLVKQLTRLVQALIVWGVDEPLPRIKRLCRDCIAVERWRIISYLNDNSLKSNSEISQAAKLAYSTTKEVNEDLWLLDILERELEGNSYLYSLKPSFKDKLEEAEL